MESTRADFPMLQKSMHGHPLVYLDSAATTQKPLSVINSMSDFYTNHCATVHRAVYEIAAESTAMHHDVRVKVQQFLGAKKSEEIIFTKGTTESINLVAESYSRAFLSKGDEIIISALEHHANIVPWQRVCEERGSILKVIPILANGSLCLDTYASLLNKNTKFVSIAHIANSIGTLHPIKRMIEMAHQVNAHVLIDGAQSAPHITINVQDLDADFFVFSGHKIYGPTGIGVLYGKEALLHAMPPYQLGGDMIKTVTLEKTSFQAPPLKFEAGTPMIAEIIGLGSAIDYLNALGLDKISAWEEKLLAHATKQLSLIPNIKLYATKVEKGAVLSFTVKGAHHLDIGTLLNLKGVAVRTGHLCAQPTMQHLQIPGIIRASFAFYNTLKDIDLFAEHLNSVIHDLVSHR